MIGTSVGVFDNTIIIIIADLFLHQIFLRISLVCHYISVKISSTKASFLVRPGAKYLYKLQYRDFAKKMFNHKINTPCGRYRLPLHTPFI